MLPLRRVIDLISGLELRSERHREEQVAAIDERKKIRAPR